MLFLPVYNVTKFLDECTLDKPTGIQYFIHIVLKLLGSGLLEPVKTKKSVEPISFIL